MIPNHTKIIFKKDELENAVNTSFSYKDVFKKLNLNGSGRHYVILKRYIKSYNISIEHFTGHYKVKNHKVMGFVPLNEILVEQSTYSNSNRLRKRLIKEGIFKQECARCKLTTWQEKPIPLELEHKNGNKKDNRLENLEILCPNCHALTDCYRGKNIKNKRYNGYIKPKIKKLTKPTILESLKDKYDMIVNLFKTGHTKKEIADILKVKLRHITKVLKFLNVRTELLGSTKNKYKTLTNLQNEINKRIKDVQNLDLTKYGSISQLSKQWQISHTQVRRFIKKYYVMV